MGKMKICLVGVGLLITVLSIYICYSIGWASGFTEAGKQAGYMVGLKEAISVQDETAFIDGCNSGIREIVQSVCNPSGENQTFRKISYKELNNFLKSDKTDELKYTDNFTCSRYALTLKRIANKQGIKCAFVVLNYKNEITGKTDTGHAINAFLVERQPKLTLQETMDAFAGKKINLWEGDRELVDTVSPSTFFVEPQSDTSLGYGEAAGLVGKPYHLCSEYWVKCWNRAPNSYMDFNCFWYYLEMYRKVEDRIVKVDLIW